MAARILFLFCFIFHATTLHGQDLWEDIDTSLFKNIDLSEVVVTAQYAPTDSRNAVHEVKVIKSKDIQQQGYTNLAEVLNRQLNFRITADPLIGNGLIIQGVGGENVQVMIDGVAVIGRVNGVVDISQINLNNVARIEVIEGAMSAQFGSNASGGVINIITNKSQVERVSLELRNQAESIGILSNNLALGLQFGKVYASINTGRFRSKFAPTDSLRVYEEFVFASGETRKSKKHPWNPKLQYSLDGMLRYKFTDSIDVRYQYRIFDEELLNYGELRRPQFKPYAFDESYNTSRQDHSLSGDIYLNSHYYLTTLTAYNTFDRVLTTEQYFFENDSSSFVASEADTSTFNAFLHRSVFSSIYDGNWDAQLGLELANETATGKRIADSTSTPINETSLANYAAWLGIRYKPTQNMTILGNLRYGSNSKYDHPLIPSLHLSWKPNRDLTIKASYAHGFRAPSLKELHFSFIDVNHYVVGNSELEAEYSKNITAGATYKLNLPADRQLSLSGKVFYTKIRNRIVLSEFAPIQYTYLNLDSYETNGFNANASIDPIDGLSIQTGIAYTRLFNELSRTTDIDKFNGITELQNELHYRIPLIETNFNISHRFFGKQARYFTNADGDITQSFLSNYNLINVNLSRNFWQNRLFVSLGIKNLLDQQSLPIVGQDEDQHSAGGRSQLIDFGRTAFAKVNLRFSY